MRLSMVPRAAAKLERGEIEMGEQVLNDFHKDGCNGAGGLYVLCCYQRFRRHLSSGGRNNSEIESPSPSDCYRCLLHSYGLFPKSKKEICGRPAWRTE